MKECNYESIYFRLYEVAPDLYAAIEKPDKAVGSNAGFFDLGDRLILFDSFLNIEAAKDLYRAAFKLTGKNISMAICSHYHSDHIIGFSAISPSVPLFSSPFTRDEIQTHGVPDLEEVRNLPEKEIEDLTHEAANGDTEEKRKNAANSLKFVLNMRHPEVQLRIPNIVIHDEISIIGSNHTVQILHVGAAHTKGDVVAYFPEEKVCFLGDLLFSNRDPWLGSGDPQKLIAFFDEFASKGIDIFVPGHGEIATQKEIDLQTQYTREIMELVTARIATNDEKPIVRGEMSPIFHGWDSPCYQWNLDFLKNSYFAPK